MGRGWAALFFVFCSMNISHAFPPGKGTNVSHRNSVPSTYRGHENQTIPSTDIDGVVEASKSRGRSCSQGIALPPQVLPSTKFDFDPIVIPKVIFTIPISLVKAGAWTFMPQETRANLIKDAVYSKASSSPEISNLLKPEQLKHVSWQVGRYFKNYKLFPGNVAVGKVAYKNFAKAMVAQKFADLELGCNESDLEWLSSAALQEFEQCLEVKTQEKELESCLAVADMTAAYKVGFLTTQILVQKILKEHVPNSDTRSELVAQAREFYRKCAYERVLKHPGKDRTVDTEVCVGASVVEATRLLAYNKATEILVEEGFKGDALKAAQKRIFSLDPTKCKLAKSYGLESPPPRGEALDALNVYFKPNGLGTKAMESEVFNCLNQLTSDAGREVVGHRLLETPEIKNHISQVSDEIVKKNEEHVGPFDDSQRAREHAIVTGAQEGELQNYVLDKVYEPCIERLKKSTKKSTLIDPEACEEEILTRTTAHLLESQLSKQFVGMSSDFTIEQKQEVAKILSKHRECVEGHSSKSSKKSESKFSDAELLECAKGAIKEFVGFKANIDLPKQLEQKLAKEYPLIKDSTQELLPDLQDKVKNIVDKCVDETFHGAKQTKDLAAHSDKLEDNCLKALTNYATIQITPKIAQRVLLQELEKTLPEGISAAQVSAPFRKAFLECVFGGSQENKSGIDSSQETSAVEKQLTACVDKYVKSTVGNVAVTFAHDSAKKFLDPTALAALDKTSRSPEKQAQIFFDACMSTKNGSAMDKDLKRREEYMTQLKDCAYAAAPAAAIEISKEFTNNATRRTKMPEIKNPTELDKFVLQSIRACDRYQNEKPQCLNELQALQGNLVKNANSATPKTVASMVLGTSIGDRIIKSELAEALRSRLSSIPVSGADTGGYYQRQAVEKIVSVRLLDTLLSSSEGKVLLNELKSKTIADPKYSAKDDKAFQMKLSKLLLSQGGSEGFVDNILYAVAVPAYEKRVKEIVDGRKVDGSSKDFWGGIMFGKISPEMVSYYPWVAQTPSSQKARDYLRSKVLEPMLYEGRQPTEAEMERHTFEIKKLLKDASSEAPSTKKRLTTQPKRGRSRR